MFLWHLKLCFNGVYANTAVQSFQIYIYQKTAWSVHQSFRYNNQAASKEPITFTILMLSKSSQIKQVLLLFLIILFKKLVPELSWR